MTQFVWNCFNHNKTGIMSLEDIIEIISGQLVALGHKAAWGISGTIGDQKNAHMVTKESGINFIVEGFREYHIREISEKYQQGARFILLATEEPTEKGFNHGTQKEMIERQEIFPKVAPFIEGIIHLVPGEHVTRWYSQFAPSAYTELGWSPTIMRNKTLDPFTRKSIDAPIIVKNKDGTQRIIPEPDFDFGFFGSLTPRRQKLLRWIEKQTGKPVRLVCDFASRTERDSSMRRAKVILQIRKFDEMGLVSSSRCNTSLAIGRPVVAEPHDLCKPWDEVVRFSKTPESFLTEAMAVRAMWKGVYQTQLAKFKATFPPEVCIGRALEQIGFGTEAQRKAS
jgi:hypothetical protein